MGDELKIWLRSQGFTVAKNNMSGIDNVGWYAWRRIEGADCECNDKPPSLVVWPYSMVNYGKTFESVEIEITGERKGVWWKLKAFAIQANEVKERLPMIEKNLVYAWNGLGI